ncbi:MAG: hypothetical protein GXO35_07660 [Gammaproteobacteria bacterium]|nr:hypothetical protein [Gammaproteobacteria bacterium]
MELDYEAAKFWLSVIQIFATLALFVYVAVTRKSQVNEKRIDSFEKHVNSGFEDIKDRVIRLEEKPDHNQEINDVHKRLNGISREVSQLSGEFKQTSEAVKRMHDYMINKGKR